MKLSGTVEKGRQEAAHFLAIGWVEEQIGAKLGFTPFPGTLNLRLTSPEALENWAKVKAGPEPVRLVTPDQALCDASVYPVLVNGRTFGAIVLPHVPGYPDDVVEIIAAEGLRNRFRLEEGVECAVETVQPGTGAPKDFYKAVLFDFEGTLVDFQWKLAPAEMELRETLRELGFDLTPFEGDNYAQLRSRALDMADSEGLKAEIDRRFGEIYDRYDADALTRWNLKPRAKEILSNLVNSRSKVAIISNVGRKGLSAALQKLGIAGVVDTIVTRNDVGKAKPSGEGITKVLTGFGVDPADALMVGDSLSDLWAARDAGTKAAIILGGESPTPALADARPEHLINTLAALETII